MTLQWSCQGIGQLLCLDPNKRDATARYRVKTSLGRHVLMLKNLAQAAPIDSLSYCSKSRIALGRELIWDKGKNARQNMSLNSSQSPFVLPTACVYHYFTFFVREKENNFHLKVSCVMPEMLRHEHISSNSHR